MIAERRLVGEFVVSGGRLRIGDVAGDRFLSVNAAVGDWLILDLSEEGGVTLICDDTYRHISAVVADIKYTAAHEAMADDADVARDIMRRVTNSRAYMDTLSSSNRHAIEDVSGIVGVSERRTWDTELGFLSDAAWGDAFKGNVNGYVPVGHGVVGHTGEATDVTCYRNELTGEIEAITLVRSA